MIKTTHKSSIIPKAVTEYDLRLLRIFRTVVENGGFSASEVELGVTRSTISVHMSNLESRMKLKLCSRGRGGFALTEDGQAVYHACIELFDSLNDFSRLINNLGEELSGELIILCADQLDSRMQLQLAEVVRRIHTTQPQLHLVLDNEALKHIEKCLLKEKAHIGLLPSYQQVEGLDYQTIYNEPIYLCCSHTHAFFPLSDDEISAEMLAQTPAIHPGIDIDSDGKEQLKQLNLSAKAYQFDTRKTLILSGCYIGYLPLSYIEQELAANQLKIIHRESASYQFSLSMVSKHNPRETSKIELLKTVFNEVFNQEG
ncbi:LysR family transcriptional regulator [Shewanella gelidimarina]|uniref:LysR family transcriptional regulator n=1 Tax=Shewanella gelidimarina TaxID=56813 RepID=UPI00200F6210|nr:LysR family transcriptional regulator [Shewanella gelidimarina]MCL1057496.1 LysR family transcriptional regulator [Shewanella gelidimarina]